MHARSLKEAWCLRGGFSSRMTLETIKTSPHLFNSAWILARPHSTTVLSFSIHMWGDIRAQSGAVSRTLIWQRWTRSRDTFLTWP